MAGDSLDNGGRLEKCFRQKFTATHVRSRRRRVCVWEDEDEEAIINNSCAWIARHSNSGGMQAAENLLRINL